MFDFKIYIENYLSKYPLLIAMMVFRVNELHIHLLLKSTQTCLFPNLINYPCLVNSFKPAKKVSFEKGHCDERNS